MSVERERPVIKDATTTIEALGLLDKTIIPSANELQQISAYLRASQQQVSDLDLKIAQLKASIDTLSNERLQILASIEPYQVLASPMRRIPVEVLQEIFVHCLPLDHVAVMDASEAPLLLGRICSAWRRISRLTPRLWASLYIPPMSIYAHDDDYLENIIKEWLDRSGDCPLSIAFKEGHTSLLQTVLDHRSRWQHIDFALYRWSPSMLNLSPDQLPMLESIKLTSVNETSDDAGGWTSFNIFQALKLRKISIRHSQNVYNASQLPWGALSTLHIYQGDSSLRLSGISNVLRVAKNLVECSLHFGIYTAPPDDLEPIKLLNLMELSVSCVGDLSQLFNNLDAPILKSFEFDFDAYNHVNLSGYLQPTISTFISRSPLLQKLSVECRSFTSEEILECARHAPRLIHLEIKNFGRKWPLGAEPCDDSFLEHFIREDGQDGTDTNTKHPMPSAQGVFL